jgi:hypothetical protein
MVYDQIVCTRLFATIIATTATKILSDYSNKPYVFIHKEVVKQQFSVL